MQSLCSRRSGEAARLSSWHREDTLSRWGKVSRFRFHKNVKLDFFNKICEWMFRAFGLDKSLSTTECGDLEGNIYGPAVGQNVLPYVFLVSSASQLRK